MPGLPVPHHLLEFSQVHIHCISDAIQPSHPPTPSSPVLSLSQHQGLFQWVICLHQMTKVLAFYMFMSSHSEYTGVVCHSLLQWITFCQNSLLWPICLGWLALYGMAHSFIELHKSLCHEKAVIVQGTRFSSVVQSCPTLCNPMNRSTPGQPVHHTLPEFTQTHVHRFSDAIQPSHPLSSPSPPAPNPSSTRVISNESTVHMRWPKYWSFSFSISPSNEHPGLISFRMDWLDLLAVQGTRKSLLQHHSSKASIFRRSAFFTVQLSHPYTTTGKTIALFSSFLGNIRSQFGHDVFMESNPSFDSRVHFRQLGPPHPRRPSSMSPELESKYLGLNPASAPTWLCNLAQTP